MGTGYILEPQDYETTSTIFNIALGGLKLPMFQKPFNYLISVVPLGKKVGAL